MKLKAIIFDIDGTLVDSNDLHAKAWQQAFAKFGKDVPREEIRGQIGKGGDLLVPDLLNGKEMRSFGDELRDYRKKLFVDEFIEQVKPFPGAGDVVRALAEKGFKIALASSAEEDEVDHYRKLLGVEQFIDASTSKDDAEHSKPSPEIFEAALGRLKTGPEEAVTVGDTPYDVLASHRAGLSIVAVLSGGFDKSDLKKAEFLLRDVGELPGRLREIDTFLTE